MSENHKNALNLNPEEALFDGQIQGLAVTFYDNERPPAGLAGLLDWYFHGAISRLIQKGAISGKVGKCTYFPLTKNGAVFHIILAGAGEVSVPGKRSLVPTETLHQLQKNLETLKLPRIGVSQTDFGHVGADYFNKHLKGVPVWITP